MTQSPTASSLVERFRLKERGRERGQDGQPDTTQPTLDNVEMEVVGHCDELYAKQRGEYHHHRAALEERLQPLPSDRGADSLVENTCKEMRDAVSEERPDLGGAAARSTTCDRRGQPLQAGRGTDGRRGLPGEPCVALGNPDCAGARRDPRQRSLLRHQRRRRAAGRHHVRGADQRRQRGRARLGDRGPAATAVPPRSHAEGSAGSSR